MMMPNNILQHLDRLESKKIKTIYRNYTWKEQNWDICINKDRKMALIRGLNRSYREYLLDKEMIEDIKKEIEAEIKKLEGLYAEETCTWSLFHRELEELYRPQTVHYIPIDILKQKAKFADLKQQDISWFIFEDREIRLTIHKMANGFIAINDLMMNATGAAKEDLEREASILRNILKEIDKNKMRNLFAK